MLLNQLYVLAKNHVLHCTYVGKSVKNYKSPHWDTQKKKLKDKTKKHGLAGVYVPVRESRQLGTILAAPLTLPDLLDL